GASSGFGRDTAETLHGAGHRVYASMRGVQGKNRETAEALRKLGTKTVEVDVSDDASVEAGVKNVLAEASKIDVLVNNAGIGSAGVTEAFTAEQAKAIFDTNVIGLLRVTRAVLPSMRPQHDGLIINIGSIFGPVSFPFTGIYGASKFAVEALTDSLRYEVSQLGIEVVEVQPSTYPTNFLANIQTPAGTEVTTSYGAVGRIPDAMFKSLTAAFEGKDAPNPHDVAEAILQLVAQAKGTRPAHPAPPAPSSARRSAPTRPTKTSRPCNPRWSRLSVSATSKESPDEPFRVSGLPSDPALLSMATQPSEGDMSSTEVLTRPTSLEQQKEDSVEFLVEFEVDVPAGTPDADVEQRQRAESAAAAKLAENGHLVRLWRRPLVGDGTTAIGLYRAFSQAQ